MCCLPQRRSAAGIDRDLHNVLCAVTDTQGFSVSEHLRGTDRGGTEGDPFEDGADELRAQNAAYRSRKLKAWSSLLISRASPATQGVANHGAR